MDMVINPNERLVSWWKMSKRSVAIDTIVTTGKGTGRVGTQGMTGTKSMRDQVGTMIGIEIGEIEIETGIGNTSKSFIVDLDITDTSDDRRRDRERSKSPSKRRLV